MPFTITKYSGEQEEFDIEKFRSSLQKAGAEESLIQDIVKKLKQHSTLRSTKEIYHFAMRELKKRNRPLAARYNLKQALLHFGPTGFPFELFVAEIFKKKGYSTKTDIIMSGFCIDHEIDVYAQKSNHCIIGECKFHNLQALKAHVKVALYVKARFEDIIKKIKKNDGTSYSCLLATNTKFTSETIKYAQCSGIELLGWGYPAHDNIQQLITQYKLFPITTLTTLNIKQKRILMGKGFILCHTIADHIDHLKEIGLKEKKIDAVIKEAHDVCAL